MEKLKKPFAAKLECFKKQKETISRLWNVSEETANLLAMLVMIKKPHTIVELGTSNGYSTFHFALASMCVDRVISTTDLPPSLRGGVEFYDTRIITIDVEPKRQDIAKENLSDYTHITFVTEKIEDYVPKIDYTIDLLFIDANKPSYIDYIQLLEPHLAHEALVIADNIDSHSTTLQYANYVTKSPAYTTIHLSIDTGLLLSIYRKDKK